MTAQRDWHRGEDFAPSLRNAIAARGLALERIRYYLGLRGHDISVATLSYWQSGRSRPERATSLAALGSLEEILEVPRGSLTTRLPPPRRRFPRRPEPDADRLEVIIDAASHVDAMIDELGLSWTKGVNRLSAHDYIELRVDRTKARHKVTELLQASEDGVDRIAIAQVEDEFGGQPYVIPGRNCRLGRVLQSETDATAVTELILERPLRAGESMVVEYYNMAIGETGPFTWWIRGCLQVTRELHMEVRFDPGDIPLTAEELSQVGDMEQRTPIVLMGNQISLLRLSFGPGAAGLRWAW